MCWRYSKKVGTFIVKFEVLVMPSFITFMVLKLVLLSPVKSGVDVDAAWGMIWGCAAI